MPSESLAGRSKDAAGARARAGIRTFVQVLGAAAPDSDILRFEGVLASRVPSTPRRSIFNSVLYEHAGALAEAYDSIANAYHEGGVRAWTVWTSPGDDGLARFLEAKGHRLDGSPIAMSLDMGRLAAGPLTGFDWEETTDLAGVGLINDEAYGYTEPAFALALRSLRDPAVRLYLARASGEPVSCVMTCDEGGDCGVYCVATRAAARRHGFSHRLMSAALLEARRRGCVTASLQASTMGYSVYRSLGFEDVFTFGLWEWRREQVFNQP